jgi:hypothetical protein
VAQSALIRIENGRSGASSNFDAYSVHMRPTHIVTVLLACLAISIAPATSGAAQIRPTPVGQKAKPAPPAPRPAAARAEAAPGDTAKASKPVSQRLFDAEWVLFPARLALVIVLLTLALFLLICGVWSAVRVAHALRHMKWSQPPRRLKRGEVGAAGTSLAVEWEERLSTNIENDEERDRQIAWLREVVDRLTLDHNRLAARVAAIAKATGVHPDGEAENPG